MDGGHIQTTLEWKVQTAWQRRSSNFWQGLEVTGRVVKKSLKEICEPKVLFAVGLAVVSVFAIGVSEAFMICARPVNIKFALHYGAESILLILSFFLSFFLQFQHPS